MDFETDVLFLKHLGNVPEAFSLKGRIFGNINVYTCKEGQVYPARLLSTPRAICYHRRVLVKTRSSFLIPLQFLCHGPDLMRVLHFSTLTVLPGKSKRPEKQKLRRNMRMPQIGKLAPRKDKT